MRQQQQHADWGSAQLVRASLAQGELRGACPAPVQAGLHLQAARCAHTAQPTCKRHIQPHPSPHPPRPHSPGDSLSRVATSSSPGAHAAAEP